MFLTALAITFAAPPPPAADLLADRPAARMLVPAYVFPNPAEGSAERKYWDGLIAAASADCTIVAVINPASGPIDCATPEMEPARVPEKENFKEKFVLPAWAEEKAKGQYVFPRQRFAVLVHSKAKLEADFVPLINNPAPGGKRVGWLFVTDRELGPTSHPWDKLPAYWHDLVKAVKAQNKAK